MELFLLHHTEWERLYNCTGLDINTVSLEKRRQFVPEAWTIITLCALYYALYVPCLWSIRQHCRANPCYQLLLYLGIMDVSILWILGFLHGWLSLRGAVFCSAPVFIYCVGAFAGALFVAESMADLILAINRCLEICSPTLAKICFGGYRILIWLGLCTGYALYWLLFMNAMLFSSLHFAWFFNPFIGYRDASAEDAKYVPPFLNYHALLIAIGSPVIYLAFVFLMKFKQINLNDKMTHAQKMVFLQVFIISIFNAWACLIFKVMQYVEPPQWLITVQHFAWFHIHGFPPIIYLALNRTLRKDCWRILQKLYGRKNNTNVIPVEIIAVSKHLKMVQSH